MAVKDWSTTAASNTGILSGLTLDGEVMTPPQVDNAFRDMAAQIASQLGKAGFKGADVASATTTDLATATGWYVDITGTTTITGLGTVAAGQLFILRFVDALVFTHNASSLILPGGQSLTTVAGDVAFMMSLGSGNWRCVQYVCATGTMSTTADGAFFGLDSDEDYTLGRKDNDGYLELQGGNDANGGKWRGYAASHATKAGDVEYYSNGSLKYNYDLSATLHTFQNIAYFNGDLRAGGNNAAAPGSGNNTQGIALVNATGALVASVNGSAHVLNVTADGSLVVLNSAGVSRGSISISGATTSFNTSSDKRLKTNWTAFDAGPVLDALEVWQYQWKLTGQSGYGILAQDAAKVFPDAVHHDEASDLWQADYSKFVPLLLAEVKALRARVAALEA